MRIYINGSPKGHSAIGHPYVDIEPSKHGVNVLFSSEDGYYIARREEISNVEILSAIQEIINRSRAERVF